MPEFNNEEVVTHQISSSCIDLPLTKTSENMEINANFQDLSHLNSQNQIGLNCTQGIRYRSAQVELNREARSTTDVVLPSYSAIDGQDRSQQHQHNGKILCHIFVAYFIVFQYFEIINANFSFLIALFIS